MGVIVSFEMKIGDSEIKIGDSMPPKVLIYNYLDAF